MLKSSSQILLLLTSAVEGKLGTPRYATDGWPAPPNIHLMCIESVGITVSG